MTTKLNKLITDGAKLQEFVTSTIKAYGKVQVDLHVAVISAIAAVCRHGNPAELNRIYDALNSNDQTALKLYVRRITVANGLSMAGHPKEAIDGIPSEVAAEMLTKGSVIGFSKGAFAVVNGHTSEQAIRMLDLCEQRFINPDGETDRYVFERNNFAEIKTFGDEETLKRIVKIIKETEGSSDTKVFNLTEGTKKYLTELKDAIGQRLSQLSLAG